MGWLLNVPTTWTSCKWKPSTFTHTKQDSHIRESIEKKGIHTLKFAGWPGMQMCLVALVGATLDFYLVGKVIVDENRRIQENYMSSRMHLKSR